MKTYVTMMKMTAFKNARQRDEERDRDDDEERDRDDDEERDREGDGERDREDDEERDREEHERDDWVTNAKTATLWKNTRRRRRNCTEKMRI